MSDSQTISPADYKEANRAFFYYAVRLCEGLSARHPHLEISVDPIIALNVAVATYDDIDRYRHYHLRNLESRRADVVKRASYFAKWIARLRPVMILRKDPAAPAPAMDLGLLANELTAIAYALALVSGDLGRKVRLDHKAHLELAYDLRYRDLTDDGLLALFQIFNRLAVTGIANGGLRDGVIEVGLEPLATC